MQFLQAFKKATGLGVTKVEPTNDEEYNEMKAAYKDLNNHCQARPKKSSRGLL
tara:strand:+ start:1689 stop:1847 length:159 start_codon:yes stop_codon:yes gene_type:complete